MEQEQRQEAIGKANPLKANEVTVTIGTFSFNIPYEEAHTQPQRVPQPKATRQIEDAQSPRPVTKLVTKTAPLQPHAANHKQPITRNQEKNQKKEILDCKSNTAPKFVKIPKPTKEWQ